jgi:hypothetical protein
MVEDSLELTYGHSSEELVRGSKLEQLDHHMQQRTVEEEKAQQQEE